MFEGPTLFTPQLRRITDDTLVKVRGPMAESPYEAYITEFVRTHTTIPVPRIRRFVTKEDGYYLALEYIPGRTLKDSWPTLNLWTKLRVIWTLRSYIMQLRRIRTAPVERPGTLGDEPEVCRGPFFTELGAGPFPTYEELTAWYNKRLEVTRRYYKGPSDAPPFDDTMPLVFTHLDLHLGNIILGTDGKIWIIDWEVAGFYPQWFEYASMMRGQNDNPPCWDKVVPYIVGNYEKQALFIRVIVPALLDGYRIDRGLSSFFIIHT
jgi:aminoglycoside phosphotransferase (APT) family kinase protein